MKSPFFCNIHAETQKLWKRSTIRIAASRSDAVHQFTDCAVDTSGGSASRPQTSSGLISCTVAIEVVLDLADHHLLNWSTALEAFGLLIPEIERLANRKYQFGLQENAEILIGGTDLLRYGFSGLDKSEAIESRTSWPMAAE